MRNVFVSTLLISAVLMAGCAPLWTGPASAPAVAPAAPLTSVPAEQPSESTSRDATAPATDLSLTGRVDSSTGHATPESNASRQAATASVPQVEPSPAPTSGPVAARAITVEELKNATYSGVYDEPITLTQGQYEGKPFVEGDPSRPIVQYIDGAELHGDLNGDGVADAVVFLLERSGGSGVFTWVAAQLNQGGRPVDAGAVRIEDRIGVKSAALVDGRIVLEVIMQGPGDAACCGSHKVRKTYALQAGHLAELASEGEEPGRISAADLNGTNWTLLELNEGQPAPIDPKVTLNFRDGQISGFGGCNNYTASFSLGDVNPLVMTTGPVVATQKSCPDPIGSQEAAYFAALGKVSHWAYVFGRLAIYYADDRGGLSRLLFAPLESSQA